MPRLLQSILQQSSPNLEEDVQITTVMKKRVRPQNRRFSTGERNFFVPDLMLGAVLGLERFYLFPLDENRDTRQNRDL